MNAIIGNKTLNINQVDNQYYLDGHLAHWNFVKTAQNKYHIIYNNQSFDAELMHINMDEGVCQLKINNTVIDVQVKDDMALLLEKLGLSKGMSKKANDLKAPMPGLILKILVTEGQEVKKGESMLLLEAMKMENVLKASSDVTIKNIGVKAGQTVEKGQLLIEFN